MNATDSIPAHERMAHFNAALWIEKADTFLNVHRSRFIYQEPTVSELELHRAALEMAIQTGNFLFSLFGDPGISLRLKLLEDAYALFHDPDFSEPEAEHLREELFPQ
jgi:hypothetical protein